MFDIAFLEPVFTEVGCRCNLQLVRGYLQTTGACCRRYRKIIELRRENETNYIPEITRKKANELTKRKDTSNPAISAHDTIRQEFQEAKR